MKYFTTLLIVAASLGSYSQSSVSKITAKAKAIALPLSNTSEAMRQWFISRNKYKLNPIDKATLIDELKAAKQLVVNPKGGTAFGDLDRQDPYNFFDDVKDIAVVGIVKQANSTGYLLYLETQLDEARNGILVACKSNGQITNWIFSDGTANGGNPHGNINRDFTMLSTGIVKIAEGAWGDNTDTYGFTATFKLANNMFVLQRGRFSQGRMLH